MALFDALLGSHIPKLSDRDSSLPTLAAKSFPRQPTCVATAWRGEKPAIGPRDVFETKVQLSMPQSVYRVDGGTVRERLVSGAVDLPPSASTTSHHTSHLRDPTAPRIGAEATERVSRARNQRRTSS